MTGPAVSAVICSYNKREDVARAVASVRGSVGADVAVLVVDNASTDGSAAHLRERFGDSIRLLQLPENTGGAGGFAAGMAAAAEMPGDYVLLLDDDAVVAPDTVARLAAHLATHPAIGAAGPAICLADQPDILQEAGGFVDEERFVFRCGSAGLPVAEAPAKPFACDYLPNCTAMTRRRVIREVGPVDASYFLYWDDVEWHTRLRRRGYRTEVVPAARSWHRGGGVTSASTVPRYYQWRNRLRFFGENRDLWDHEKFAATIEREALQAVAFSHLSGSGEFIPAILQALRDAAAGRWGRLSDGIDLPRITRPRIEAFAERLRQGGPYRLVAETPAIDRRTLLDQCQPWLVDAGDSSRPVHALHVFDHLMTADWSVVGPGDVATDRYLNRVDGLEPSQLMAALRSVIEAAGLLRRALASPQMATGSAPE